MTGGDRASSSSSGGEPQWCLHGESVVLPEEYDRGSIRPDTNGDGRDEWWTTTPVWDAVAREGSTRFTVHELENQKFELQSDLVLFGSLLTLGDVDGDGTPDVALQAWNDPEAWWQRGLGDFTFETTQRPFAAPPRVRLYAEVNGDGLLDVLEQQSWMDAHLSLRLGDGAGGFVVSSTIGGGEHTLVEVFPGSTGSEKLLRFQFPFAGTQEEESFFQLVDVTPAGEITVKASATALGFLPTVIADVNGDGISDILGGGPYGSRWMRSDGDRYEEEVLGREVRGIIPGPWTDPRATDALVWDETLRLYEPADNTWRRVETVQTSPGFEWHARHLPLLADDDGRRDFLQIGDTHSLWRFERCD